jgi:hypothetical protein
MGKGGGGGPTQTTSTVQNTNVPEYAKGYVENMLGATQQQLFQGTRGPDVTNPETGEVTQGNFNITGFKPYQAYGGTYDAQGNQTAYDPTKGIAGYSDLQRQAQRGVGNMQLDPAFSQASSMAQQAGRGGMDSANLALGYGAQGAAAGQQGQQLGIQGGQRYGEMGANYGAQGAGYGAQGAGLANKALSYGDLSSQIGQMGLQAQQTGQGITEQSQRLANQQAMAGQRYEQMAQDPRAMQSYMSPYMQNVVDVTNREAERASAIQGTQQQGEATRAGALGGGRDAIMRAERERNLATLKNQNQAMGQQKAFENAQAAQQFGTTAGLTGLSGAQTGLGTALQGGQLGLSGIGTALQGQQGALAGVGAANQAYQTGIQGSQAGMQGASIGLQGVDRQLAGTAQGMQGAGMGLQGVSGAQAGYGLANQAANNMSSIAGQRQGAELGMYNAQNTMGAQMQGYEQKIKDQAVLDYANAQQYPLMQLGTMSNMLRGLPMQASTTNQYAAAPNATTQAVGTIGAGASIYNAMKPGGAAGGLPSEFKYAKGGIMSYDMGGEVEDQLENMDEKGLAAQAKESSSPSIRKMAQRILRERQMGNKPQGTGPMGVQYQAAQPQMPSYAPGGIVAFAAGDRVYGGPSSEADEGEAEAKIDMEKRLAQPAPTTGGIMGATTQPTTPTPYAPQAGRAMQQAPNIPDFMKAEYADTEKRMNAPLSSFMAERKAAMQEAGIADVSEGQRKQREELMAEKANMADEKQRQKYMRMAEFFASWGSTPGPTLVAGMNALKQSVPGIISDEKEQKKARREIDKSIADLDNATRLEKRGEVDAAMALKLKAAEDMKALNIKFIDYQSRRESDASSFAASKYNADMQLRGEEIRAATARLDRAARRETDADAKAFGQYQTAAQQEQRLISKIADQAKMFDKDYATIKTAEMNAGANDGKMNPALVPGYEAAKKKIADQEAIWTKQKEQAARDTDLAYGRVRINPQATKDYTKSSAAPAPAPTAAPSGGPISGEFSAPTAAHISALKANPTQAAAFDAKFGPGAAKEYLGK